MDLDGPNEKGPPESLEALLNILVAGARNPLNLEFSWSAA